MKRLFSMLSRLEPFFSESSEKDKDASKSFTKQDLKHYYDELEKNLEKISNAFMADRDFETGVTWSKDSRNLISSLMLKMAECAAKMDKPDHVAMQYVEFITAYRNSIRLEDPPAFLPCPVPHPSEILASYIRFLHQYQALIAAIDAVEKH